ncbi:MAG: hypothetical protein ACTIMZ_10275 [Pseudoalteromonas distincta]|uniref:hypothetical protein n=1 Tax=Pseudoalteromonas distincta TaxID=77608 RepID=UPI003F95ED14
MRKKINENGLIICLSLFSLFVIIISNVYLQDANTIYPILTSVASAMIAGVILSVTVERLSSEQRESETRQAIVDIKKNLFRAIYSRSLPDVIFNEVQESLLNSNVVRRKYTIDYIIKPLKVNASEPECHDHFLCSVSSAYELENITNKVINHKVHFGLEASVDSKYSRHTKITSFRCDGKAQDCENKDDDRQVSIETTVEIKPGHKILVNMQGQLVKRDTDSELWSSLIPSDGVSLRVTSQIDGLDIDAKINNSQDLTVITFDKEAGVYHWDHTNGIFPYQSIVFWWSKREKC